MVLNLGCTLKLSKSFQKIPIPECPHQRHRIGLELGLNGRNFKNSSRIANIGTWNCTCVVRRGFGNALPFQESHPLGALMYIRGVSSQLSITALSLQVQGQKWEIIVEKMVRGYFRCRELSCFYNPSDTNHPIQSCH